MKNKKKLLILVNYLSFFISHRLPIAETAKNKGFEVFIGYGELRGADPKSLINKGFNVVYIPMEPGGINVFKDLQTFYYIWKLLRGVKPDIVHLITIKPYLYGGIISRLLKVPALVSAVSGLGSLFGGKDIKSFILRVILFPIFKLTFNHSNQKVIFQNKDDLKFLVEKGILNSSKTKIINGSGVKLEKFSKFREPGGVPVVCFASRLLKDKGVFEYVNAAELLKNRGVKARFFLAGELDTNSPSGLNLSELKKIKKKKFVKVLGFKKNIAKLYANSNIICLPSFYKEGLPKSLIEAAAASRAIVTTDVPGCRDAIIPNKTGLLVPAKDTIKLADALQWLIENPKKRIAMGIEGRKFAKKKFPIEKIVKEHLVIYKKLLKKT